MKIKAYLDNKVVEELINLISKRSNNTEIDGFEVMRKLSKMDSCFIQTGYWEKSPYKTIFYKLLGQKGKSSYEIQSERYYELLEKRDHFSLTLTSGKNKKAIISSTPLLTLENLLDYIENYRQLSFNIKSRTCTSDFLKTHIIHNPTSIIINDRYFFNESDPVEIIDLIIQNIISPDYSGKITITLFYSKPDDPDLSVEDAIDDVYDHLKNLYPAINFNVETPIENIFHSITHDRFIITDFVCFKSEKSFSFLTKKESTTIHRYAIYDPENFKSNVEYLTEFFDKSRSNILKSKNPIIRSFLRSSPK